MHLDVDLGTTSGDVADAEFAIHARHVAKGHFVGSDNAGKDAIDMGWIRVEWDQHRDRYRLVWPE